MKAERTIPRGLSILVSATLLLGFILAFSSARAVTWHVAPNGDPDGPYPSQNERRSGDGSEDSPFRDLQTVVARAERLSKASSEPFTIRLLSGHHWLDSASYVDPTCGNCSEPNTSVPATLGLRLSGRRIRLLGDRRSERGREGGPSVLHTRAGYGVLIEDCDDCEVQGLVITDGVRDPDEFASNAAIVVRRSNALIRANRIVDNIGEASIIEDIVVGIMGIVVREGGRVRIEENQIHRNSWDGIALYRGAEASVFDNDIDGIDLALGRSAGGGRGVGIGVTWNARANIRGNRVARYWKGIGIFVDGQAEVEGNVVEQIATWGLSLWDAGRGRPMAKFRWNLVDSTGACGATIVRGIDPGEASIGELTGNLFARTGQNPKYDSGEPYCYQVAIALHEAPEIFRVEGNTMVANREPGNRLGSGDVDPAVLPERTLELSTRLAAHRPTRESAAFRRWLATEGSARWGREDRK